MNLVILFFLLLVLSSLNIPVIIFSLISLFSIKHSFNNFENYAIILILFFILFFPVSFTGYNSLLKHENISIFIALLLIILLLRRKVPFVRFRLKPIFFMLLSILFIYSMIVYFPIILATYFDYEIIGPESNFISNKRDSHMLSFVFPFVFSPFIMLFISQMNFTEKNLSKVIKYLLKFTFIIVILSLIQYIFNFNFIPQDYSDVRFDGNRLTGLTRPDSNDFGRSLLFPFCLSLSYFFTFKKNLINKIFLLFIIFGIFLTGGRTIIFSSIICFTLISFFYKRKKLLFASFIISLIFSSFFIDIALRNQDTINLSGRANIYALVFNVLMVSPFVGLRPGGYITYLINSFVSQDGTILKAQSTHSFYFETAVNWGIPSLVILLLIIMASLKLSLSNIKKLNYNNSLPFTKIFMISSFCTLFVFLILGLTEVVPYQFIYLFIGILVSMSYLKLKNN